MKMKLSQLKIHPDNERIYSPTNLEELENSIQHYGLMEPIAITKAKKIISGHRRFVALKNLGIEDVEVRIIDPDNEICPTPFFLKLFSNL